MTIFLGIDPGLGTTGFGIIKYLNHNLSFITAGIIKTCSKAPIDERLFELHNKLAEIIIKYKPQYVAIEETFVNKNALSSLKLAHARASLILTAKINNLSVNHYPANIIKKSVVGTGHADKNQVAMMVKQLLPLANHVNYSDATDALAIAICDANHINSAYSQFYKKSYSY